MIMKEYLFKVGADDMTFSFWLTPREAVRRMHEYTTAYHVASVYFLRLKGVHLVGLETSEGGVLYNVIEKNV